MEYKKIALSALCVAGLSLSLVACSPQKEAQTSQEQPVVATQQADSKQQTQYPLTIKNNGKEWTYDRAPERAVVLDYNTAEIFAALGLEKHVVKLAQADFDLEDVADRYRDAVKSMPEYDRSQLISGSVPSYEQVISENPDAVFGTAYSFFDQSAGSADKYIEAKINCYASEPSYEEKPSIEHMFNDIRNIGKIYGVSDKAEALVKELEARFKVVSDKLGKDIATVPTFVYDLDLNGMMMTVGAPSFESYLLSLAGGSNAFGSIEKQYGKVSDEQLLASGAQHIILTAYSEAVDTSPESKKERLLSSEQYASIPAVKDKKITIVRAYKLRPGLQAIDGVEEMAKALHPDKF